MKYSPAWSRVAVKPASRQTYTATKVARAMMLFISEFLHWSIEPKVCLSRVDVRGGLMRLKGATRSSGGARNSGWNVYSGRGSLDDPRSAISEFTESRILSLGCSCNPADFNRLNWNIDLGGAVKKLQEDFDSSLCVRRFLNDGVKSSEWSANNRNLLPNFHIATSGYQSIRSHLTPQKAHDRIVNRCWHAVKTH